MKKWYFSNDIFYVELSIYQNENSAFIMVISRNFFARRSFMGIISHDSQM